MVPNRIILPDSKSCSCNRYILRSSFNKLFIHFSFQIEREKADLSVQVIGLQERLEEAEGGAESQVRDS